MEKVFARLTIYFEDPFWIGLYEREENGCLAVSRMVFGTEPKEPDVYERLCKTWAQLRFGPAVPGTAPAVACRNPKRRQRTIRQALSRRPGETYARQAVQAGREQAAQVRKAKQKERLQAEKERKFQLRQQKKKQKHRSG